VYSLKVDRFDLVQTKCPKWQKEVRNSQGSIGGLWKPVCVALRKSREALTRVPIRPGSNSNILIKKVNSLEGPWDSVRPGTYRQAFIMAINKRTLQRRGFS
jgi:hypothetical protein